jgi:hypothetical protein
VFLILQLFWWSWRCFSPSDWAQLVWHHCILCLEMHSKPHGFVYVWERSNKRSSLRQLVVRRAGSILLNSCDAFGAFGALEW